MTDLSMCIILGEAIVIIVMATDRDENGRFK